MKLRTLAEATAARAKAMTDPKTRTNGDFSEHCSSTLSRQRSSRPSQGVAQMGRPVYL